MESKLGKKLMTSNAFSGTLPSPESSLYNSEDYGGTGNPKGWYSERVPHSSYRRARKEHVVAAARIPFSSGRALPSKWDDAERWISSPVSSVDCGPNLAQRRAKSKSGPLGPPGPGSSGGYNSFSPVLGVGVINGTKWRNSSAAETITVAGGDGGGGGEGRRRSCPGHGDPEWLDLWGGPLSPNDKRDVNFDNDGFETNFAHDNFKSTATINNNNNNNDNDDNNGSNDEAKVDRVISRRDMATQMYPESESSTPNSAHSPSPLLENEPNYMSVQSPGFEVRDVQIDRQSSRATQGFNPKGNETTQNISSSTSIVDEDIKLYKLQRKEARINAWESLQKAKAESAIQKLELKLEKKRASSMEKIMEKLRRAEIKAQKMKGSIVEDNDHVRNHSLLKTNTKIHSLCRKIRLSSTIRSCSTCYRF